MKKVEDRWTTVIAMSKTSFVWSTNCSFRSIFRIQLILQINLTKGGKKSKRLQQRENVLTFPPGGSVRPVRRHFSFIRKRRVCGELTALTQAHDSIGAHVVQTSEPRTLRQPRHTQLCSDRSRSAPRVQPHQGGRHSTWPQWVHQKWNSSSSCFSSF